MQFRLFRHTIIPTLLTAMCAVPATTPCRAQRIPGKKVPAPPSRQAAEQIVRNTLNGMNSFGWDDKNHGIFINWRRPDPSQVQCRPGKCDAADNPTRHDPLNDVRTLQSLYWYKSRHPEDTTYDAAIDRLIPGTRARYANTTLNKGYLYPVFLRLAQYATTPEDRKLWQQTLVHWAEGQYQRIDPALGVQHNRQGNCDCGANTIYLDDAYRVGFEVENGAALIHAGTVAHHPEWVKAGYRELRTAYDQAYSQEYHLFGRIYVIADHKYGKGLLWDTQATPNDASEEADLILRAALVATDPVMREFLLTLVKQMLDALRSLPLHDRVHGGFTSAFYIADHFDGHKKGTVRASGREARQLSLLGTLDLANKTMSPHNQWADIEDEELVMALHTVDDPVPGMRLPDTIPAPAPFLHGYPESTGGYMYSLTLNFQLIQHEQGPENWISAEACNLALIGLQQWLTPAQPD